MPYRPCPSSRFITRNKQIFRSHKSGYWEEQDIVNLGCQWWRYDFIPSGQIFLLNLIFSACLRWSNGQSVSSARSRWVPDPTTIQWSVQWSDSLRVHRHGCLYHPHLQSEEVWRWYMYLPQHPVGCCLSHPSNVSRFLCHGQYKYLTDIWKATDLSMRFTICGMMIRCFLWWMRWRNVRLGASCYTRLVSDP